MNILKAGVTGKFIFIDSKTKEKIAEFKNDISDYGMKRLAGFQSHNTYAVAENFKHIHLGESDTPVNRFSIYNLLQPLVPGTDMTVVHGSVADASIVPPPTRTEYVRNGAGGITVRFINNWDVTFNRGVVIREVGVSHVNYAGDNRPRTGGYGGSFSTDSSRTNLQDNIDQSLFSRATLSPSQTFATGQSVRVVYICEIALCPEVEWIENLFVDTSSLTAVPIDPSDVFPDSKINMRQKPFYELNANGDPVDYFVPAGGNIPNTGVKTCPILDSMSEPPRGLWQLDSFLPSGSNPYSTFTSTMTSEVTIGITPVPSPITSERMSKSDGSTAPKTHVTRHYPATSGYIVNHPSQDEWTTTIRFVIRSEDMPTSTDATLWTLWRAYDSNQQIPAIYKGMNGLTFSLENAFRPTANKLFGLDFKITWTR